MTNKTLFDKLIDLRGKSKDGVTLVLDKDKWEISLKYQHGEIKEKGSFSSDIIVSIDDAIYRINTILSTDTVNSFNKSTITPVIHSFDYMCNSLAIDPILLEKILSNNKRFVKLENNQWLCLPIGVTAK